MTNSAVHIRGPTSLVWMVRVDVIPYRLVMMGQMSRGVVSYANEGSTVGDFLLSGEDDHIEPGTQVDLRTLV